VLEIVAGGLPCRGRQRLADRIQQLPAVLVQTDQQSLGIRRSLAYDAPNLRVPDESAVGHERHSPLLLQPRLECVCCKARRTVSWETAGTTSSRPRSSASGRSSYRWQSRRGFVQAKITG
jgi:hypothetical protein